MFEFVEEALDEVALSIEFAVDRAADPNVALAGDVGDTATCGDQVDDVLGVVPAVSDNGAGERQVGKQRWRRGLVRGLACGDDEADRQPAVVGDDVDLGRQSAPRASDGVIRAPFLPPAACWWARTIDESIR